MVPGRLPAAFTDDTEIALALAESLLHQRPLDLDDLAAVCCLGDGDPPDIRIQQAGARRVARGGVKPSSPEQRRIRTPATAR